MNMLRELERRYCINEDRREISQAYLRALIFIGCMIYCFAKSNTKYLQSITLFAFLATLFWLGVAWRKPWSARVRHIGALAYDCAIIGLVMIGFGANMMGMFAVLLWVSIGYGLRYRSPLYLKLGMGFTSATFIVSALVTHWQELGVFLTLLFTLIIIPLALLPQVTDLIQMVDRLADTNKLLDDANKAKSRLISDVAHDLLTPVSSIIGYCALSPPSIDGIRINAYQLARQIRAILGRSATDNLAYDEPSEAFVPDDLLRQIAMIVKPLAESRGIRIVIADHGVLGTFTGPYHALSICLMNLVNNAAKHSGGTRVTLSAEKTPGGLVFEVADDGVGISPAHQKRVFDRFHRVATTPDAEGLGLGLSIVKDTIEKMDGSIELFSTTVGSTFRLRAPVTLVDPSSVPSVMSSRETTPVIAATTTVLFVDDEIQSRHAWSNVLREAGYSVHSTSSGAEALAAMDSGNDYDIGVLDYRMPGMNGIELATAIRRRKPAMRLIAISADDSSTFTQALELRLLDAALQKPMHPAAFLSTVDHMRPTQRHLSLHANTL